MQRVFSSLFILCVFSLLLAGYFRELTAITQDLGRHILTGNIILQTKQVPTINLFSYTYPDYPFINHHWLSEVVFAGIFNNAGYQGLMSLALFLIFAAFGALVLFLHKKAAPLMFFTASLLYLPILFERTDIRPELFSFLFLSVFVVTLYKYRKKFTRLIFLLIPLELLWVNLHIYFPIGLLVIGLFLVDEVIIQRNNLKQKHTVLLLIIFGLCSLATLFNPHGIEGALYPLNVFNNYGYAIEENQTPFFLSSLGIHKTSYFYLKIGLVLLFVTLSLTWRKAKPIDWLLALTFSVLALIAVRNFPLFAFATFVPFTTSLSLLYEEGKKRLQPARASLIALALGVFLFIGFFFSLKTTTQAEHTGFSIPQGAEKAVDFFIENNLKGPIFNNFDIGSYLEYRLYPKENVFIDGRPEAYPASFIQDVYIPMQQDLKIFQGQEKKYEFNVIIFSHTDMTPWAQDFLGQIATESSWKPVYLDPMMVIFLKRNTQNTALVSRYANDLEALPVSNLRRDDLRGALQLVNFYSAVGKEKKEAEMLQHVLNLDPNNCYALANTSSQLARSNHPLAGLYLKKYQLSCQ